MRKGYFFIKRFSILVLLSLIVLSTIPSTVQAKTRTMTVKVTKKKNSYKKTLNPGQNLKLKIKNGKTTLSYKKVKFKSSKKGIASVSKKGVITARKSGRAVITVKYKKKSAKISVTINDKSAGESRSDAASRNISNSPHSKTADKKELLTSSVKSKPESTVTQTPKVSLIDTIAKKHNFDKRNLFEVDGHIYFIGCSRLLLERKDNLDLRRGLSLPDIMEIDKESPYEEHFCDNVEIVFSAPGGKVVYEARDYRDREYDGHVFLSYDPEGEYEDCYRIQFANRSFVYLTANYDNGLALSRGRRCLCSIGMDNYTDSVCHFDISYKVSGKIIKTFHITTCPDAISPTVKKLRRFEDENWGNIYEYWEKKGKLGITPTYDDFKNHPKEVLKLLSVVCFTEENYNYAECTCIGGAYLLNIAARDLGLPVRYACLDSNDFSFGYDMHSRIKGYNLVAVPAAGHNWIEFLDPGTKRWLTLEAQGYGFRDPLLDENELYEAAVEHQKKWLKGATGYLQKATTPAENNPYKCFWFDD